MVFVVAMHFLSHVFQHEFFQNMNYADFHSVGQISRHTVVCRETQENRVHANYMSILTGTTKSRFSHIRNSMVFYPKNTKVTVEVPTYQWRLHTKFEKKLCKAFQDMSKQAFNFFSSSFLHT